MPSKAAPSELPPYNPLCPTATFTMVPPCIPPTCPHKQTPCDFHKPMPTWEVRKREPEPVAVVEEVVTIKTVSFTGTPTAIRDPGCTVTPTITEFATCPTYTCVPYCDAAQVVR
ncbi:hypothetical protein EJ04DRAFT_507243 [Polyplosphaeria fusca]|uniref:Uncharacterized protein n=1 Tax=Polyplosphaeria fusca TaxID=682080 RepID=A0A9P4R9E5_9PLEO|nr:hypothetical protein EJ04DRAFT_507243 [Polyplosphaeria fusca]